MPRKNGLKTSRFAPFYLRYWYLFRLLRLFSILSRHSDSALEPASKYYSDDQLRGADGCWISDSASGTGGKSGMIIAETVVHLTFYATSGQGSMRNLCKGSNSGRWCSPWRTIPKICEALWPLSWEIQVWKINADSTAWLLAQRRRYCCFSIARPYKTSPWSYTNI